ncbi:uncharacterized protein LOC131664166 [Phymastichus coffea]|uniref:uncharacterized protein LOC131664166 n=1 Tax=Phymastichus coffea TaxID=108790 RepID=UPI00273C5F1B|nr:uncharacterized protein LOC131664166 [Phymastichus coffea]
MTVKGLWGEASFETCERVICAVEGTRGPLIIEHALTAPNLELPAQIIPREIIERVKRNEGLEFETHRNAQPRVLLGQDNWRLIEPEISRQLEGTGIVISRSVLGWAVHGYLEESTDNASNRHIHTICCTQTTCANTENERLAELDVLIKNYFDLENLGVSATTVRQSDKDRATRILRETTRKVGKAWETGLLWKTDTLPKIDTRGTALKRLYALERKLDRDIETATAYYREMDRFIENGYAVKVDNSLNSAPKRYISHFFVKNPNKPGKVRPVLDAAEKTEGVSFNDLLDKGPDLLQPLTGVLLRFREYPFAVIGDIKDMYLRIKVREKDRAVQHLLYRGADRRREPDEYQMTCLIFGSKSSPCSALYVKNKNAEQYATVKPEAAKSLVRNCYMDDYLTSGKSVAAMRKLVNDVIFINKEANFEMHGWASNVPEIVRDVRKENLLCKNEKANLCDDEDRVLDLFWDRENDCLRFNVGIKKLRDDLLTGARKPTKREFCSIVMSVYDPLGILSPFSINAKIMLQHIWRSGVAWDAKIRDEEFQTWKAWLQNLLEITTCKISRCFIPMGVDYARTELHVFCDASLQAYAAVAYLRTTSPDGKVYLSLVMAKTRVAPVKPTTIPRLELQAAVLGTRLATNISKELDIKINNVVFWSDSSTVLQWIRVGPHLKLTYVKNRLGEIAEITQVSQWRWVPTRMNPEDNATRASTRPMYSTDRWLTGPEFLRGPPSSWPEERKLKGDELVQINKLETRKDFIGTSIANIVTTPLTAK